MLFNNRFIRVRVLIAHLLNDSVVPKRLVITLYQQKAYSLYLGVDLVAAVAFTLHITLVI